MADLTLLYGTKETNDADGHPPATPLTSLPGMLNRDHDTAPLPRLSHQTHDYDEDEMSLMEYIRQFGNGVVYAKMPTSNTAAVASRTVVSFHDLPATILFTPHQVSSETSKAFIATRADADCCGSGGPGIEVAPERCSCLPIEAIRKGDGVPIKMGRLTDGTHGQTCWWESGGYDGPVFRSVHPGLAHLSHMYRGSCGGLERKVMEDEWDDNQTRLEELTKLGFLEYTLGPQCVVCDEAK